MNIDKMVSNYKKAKKEKDQWTMDFISSRIYNDIGSLALVQFYKEVGERKLTAKYKKLWEKELKKC